MSNLPHYHPTRRTVLQAGSIGLMGLGMNHLGLIRSLAGAQTTTSNGKARNVIYIFLSGGLAQHESFDMKPEAPREIRGEFSPIRTRTPGLHICEHLPELAKRIKFHIPDEMEKRHGQAVAAASLPKIG